MTHTFSSPGDAHCFDCGGLALPPSSPCLPGDLRRAKEENYRLRQVLRRAYFYITDIELSAVMAEDAVKALCLANMGTP